MAKIIPRKKVEQVVETTDAITENNFKTKVDVKELSDVLGTICLVLKTDDKNKVILEQKNDKLSIVAQTDMSFLKVELDSTGSNGIVSINGLSLHKIVSNLKCETIEINKINDAEVELSGKKYKSSLSLLETKGAKIRDFADAEKLKIPTHILGLALNKVSFACSKDLLAGTLTSLYFELKDNQLNIVGSDGIKISTILYPVEAQDINFLIKPKQLMLLNKILECYSDEEEITLGIKDNRVFFNTESFICGLRLSDGEYTLKDVYKAFRESDQFNKEIKVEKNNLIDGFNLALSHDDTAIMFKIKDDILHITNPSKKFDIVVDGCEIQTDNNFIIEFNSCVLNDVLNRVKSKDSEIITLYIKDDSMMIKPAINEYQYNCVFALNGYRDI